jgi:hypothetical protein
MRHPRERRLSFLMALNSSSLPGWAVNHWQHFPEYDTPSQQAPRKCDKFFNTYA